MTDKELCPFILLAFIFLSVLFQAPNRKNYNNTPGYCNTNRGYCYETHFN